MSLEYNITSKTTGNDNTSSQVLTQNTLGYFNSSVLCDYFSYDYPTYRIEGASFRYYEEDYNSISYDITNGKIYTLIFTANSQSISGTTILTFDLYQLSYEDYLNFILNDTGTTVDIETNFQQPLVSIDIACSGITLDSNIFEYNFPTHYKNIGSLTQNIFSDKNQYILDTVFSFEKPNDLTLGDAYYLDDDGNPIQEYLVPSASTYVSSNLGPQIITGNTPFSGLTINGSFFTYFVPPKKPNLNVSGGRSLISVQGDLTTLSPIFNFNNVDDGDYYQLQVNYDITDTAFSGDSIYTYSINKQSGDAEFVRTFSTPLRANDSFIYRIGNTKELINIFNNKQAITIWSDSIEATINSTGLYTLSGYTWRNYISNTYNGSYEISGMTIFGGASTARTFTFSTSNNIAMGSGTISATTNSIDTITIEYNGSVSTLDWQNAVESASGWTSLGLNIINGSSGTGVTSSSFSFDTQWQGMPNVSLTLTNIYKNTQLDLSIDIRSSESTVFSERSSYNDTVLGQTITRTSDSNGFFNFGNLDGGYYLLTAMPSSPTYAMYEPIQSYITINDDTSLDLIFSIVWGNDSFTFGDLSDETFL